MTAAVYQLPGSAVAPADRPSLNLRPDEVQDASGGYVRPADQLRALHARGFTRAFRGPAGRVVLERSHYEAVTRGHFGQAPAVDQQQPAPRATPNRAAFKAMFRQHNRKA